MRIDAISITNVYDSKKSYATKRAIKAEKFDVPEIQNDEFKKSDNLTDVSKISSPAFMGKKGFVIGGLLGTGIGSIISVGAFIASGGLAAPIIAAIALGVGTAGGAIAGDEIEGDDPDGKPPQYGGSSNDGIDPPYCP